MANYRYWQCCKCGKQVYDRDDRIPRTSSCPEGSNHVWG